jgi:hypothetical protein
MTVDTSPEAIAALLDGVTDGPWEYRPCKYDDWGTVKAGNFVLLQARDPLRCGDAVLDQCRRDHVDPRERNARFIASARQLVPALAAENAALKAEVARLREALEWYGEQARLCRIIHSAGDAGRTALSEDGGSRARATLKGNTDEP